MDHHGAVCPTLDVTASLGPSVLPAVDVLLADGSTAHLRSVASSDRSPLVEFHRGLSSESASLRYFGAHPQLSEADLDRITRCSPEDYSLVAERGGHIVALAEYHRLVGHDEAEVAFVVDDVFQGRGLGTILLEHLASEARRHGVRRFVADAMLSNSRMLEVFHEAGFSSTTRLDSGIVRVVLDIAPSPESIEAAEARDRRAAVRSIERLLRPRSIAVIGASRTPGTIGHELVRNLVGGSFGGPVYPVNPAATAIASVPCWPSITAISGEVDLAIVAVRAASVLDVVRACGDKGVGALVVVSAGFAETGAAGADTQRKLTAVAHERGMRLVGPNCFGVVNTDPDITMNATFAPDQPLRGRVGFASQSGGLGIAILAEARARGVGVSSFVSMGNKADVSGNDLLAWWDEDPDTDVALLYLESFGNPRSFSRLARRMGRRKPIVAVKAGRSEAGANAASSHTAALASSDRAVDALFRESGVVRVDTVEELFDVAEVLVHQPLPAGARVGIVTNAGGPGVLAADACARGALVVPELSAAQQMALRDAHPGAASVRNPVDLLASASGEDFRRAVELLATSDEVDAVLVIFTPPLVTQGDDVARGVVAGIEAAATAGSALPVVATFFGTEEGRAVLGAAARPVPCFTYPETAVRALAHAVAYGRWRARPTPQPVHLSDIDVNAARRRLIERDEDGWVTGSAAMRVLESFGISTLSSVTADDADAAAEAAEQLGLPVALKALGRGIVHKAEIGGVRLDLVRATDVRRAYREMAQAIGPAMTGAVVQPMANAGVEVITGFVEDPQFGPVVLFGMGGTAVELVGDYRVGLAPVGLAEAREMVLGVRAARLLTGYRGAAPLDIDAVVELVVRMSRLAEDLPEIAEADCNPAIVSSSGVVVVDARLRVTAGKFVPLDDRRRLR